MLLALYLAAALAIDGDTLHLDGKVIRLWGIDAPEKRQACTLDGHPYRPGPEATSALSGLLSRLGVACEAKGKDRYRRTVAVCRDWPKYSKGAYAAIEAEAKAAGRGMWKHGLVCRGEWERRHGR